MRANAGILAVMTPTWFSTRLIDSSISCRTLGKRVIAIMKFNEGLKATLEPPQEMPLLEPKTIFADPLGTRLAAGLGVPLIEFHFGECVEGFCGGRVLRYKFNIEACPGFVLGMIVQVAEVGARCRCYHSSVKRAHF